MLDKIYVVQHCAALKLKAAQRYNIAPEKCHIGHLMLQGLFERPDDILQIDAALDKSESNLSVAKRSMRLASAMGKFGLQTGDTVIISGPNTLDICVPLFASHYNGYSTCGIDPIVPSMELRGLMPYIKPKIIFCQKSCKENIKNALLDNNLKAEIVCFDDKDCDLEAFVQKYKGTEYNFRPTEFDHSKINAWLMLTSGTTGVPKVAMYSFESVLNGIYCWWQPHPAIYKRVFLMGVLHWLSSYLYYVAGPLRCYTRLQSSAPLTGPNIIGIINKYKPNVTAWVPYLINQFVMAAKNDLCDLSCFEDIVIGGGSVDPLLLAELKKYCPAKFHLVYGMTELLVPVFEYDDTVPTNSLGYPMEKYQYKLVDDDVTVYKPQKSGELWIKGDDFFKGYLNNPDETKAMMSEDGWLKTGDIFYKDEQDYYYFVERKRLLIRRSGHWITPLVLENVIKRHPAVVEACVVGIPDDDLMERATAAIMKKNGVDLDPQEIFHLLNDSLSENQQLTGGLFIVDSYPMTPSGKVNRSKLRQIAINAPKIMPE